MAGLGSVANALANTAPTNARWDLVGPTVDDDIRRAISRYGADEVKRAAMEQTKKPPGNPGIDPFPDLIPFLDEDAREWMAGGDPFESRKDNAIATAYAESKGLKSFEANKKRAVRFLSGKRKDGLGRRFWVLYFAWHFSATRAHPYTTHIRAIEALLELEPGLYWQRKLDEVHQQIRDYTTKHGNPSDDATMKEIVDGARAEIEQSNALAGLFGLRDVGAPDLNGE